MSGILHRLLLLLSQNSSSVVLLIHGVPECDSWSPPNTLSSIGNLGIQLIDLLQGESLGLVDHEVHECDTNETAAAPDKEDLGLQVCVARAVVD